MRIIIASAFLFFATVAKAQTHSLEKIWETDTVVAVPESVLPVKDILYVSLIDGGGWNMDGKGGIAKISRQGKIIDSTWIQGLHAPKGLGIIKNRLYAADIEQVIVINLHNGKIEKRISIEGAKGLNDITTTDQGVIYVSDSRTGRIWRIENDLPTLYIDSVKGVNGLKAVGNDLYIGAGKQFLKADAAKLLTKIVELPQGIDGIEPVGNGDFLLTAWAGYVWYVQADGQFQTLKETHQQKKNTADIGYDPQQRIVYVPSFNGKTVAAYKLK